ncbi:oligopeptide transport system permease protein AppB [Alicyclobacillus hesperidum subsp. aegles]|uniref:Oligopeptide transport system permease protein AppB n=1 Tax=Alicyclobacillus hesperidum TaxID=89784 RepID=A0A1H2QEC9_9BACL|nr:ABC transporter permease [Alicyclobacillus hesperidum]KRW92900.1 ABC transporter [Alicyclobacillus tengchongensis]GLG01442.1 oligopeptide transport system permease protein AppB [Alicyclobacillus hesperidum subsp. aegles]GLV12688.1 oligopeptide transport system permease protein AppB [Alicyclobacillus hesperidum]SDW05158.1 peptide/nickel transport system permease protein [Alicyclobacillus hesperidum]
MLSYIVRRIMEAIPALLGISIISFILLHIVPGNPVRIMLGQHYTAQRAAALSASLGLNKPLYMQYLIWLGNLVRGNLGYSYNYSEPVTSLIVHALPTTLSLVLISTVFAQLFAMAIGTIQAYFENSIVDHIVSVLNYFFYSMPSFWLGILLVIFFAIDLHWFPSGGVVNPQDQNPGFADWLHHLVLPAATLTLITLAGYSRYMRSSVRETLLLDYVRTARAKGLRESQVMFRHVLRNSILPQITLFGLSFPGLFAGALFIEEIFNYPGMGLLYWNATGTLDYPVLLGVTMFLGVLTIVGNLLADILYSLVDPRISFDNL